MTDPWLQFTDHDEAARIGADLQTRAVAAATVGMEPKVTPEERLELLRLVYPNLFGEERS